MENALEARQEQFPPTDCIIQALKLCLESSNSAFNNKDFLQADGTAQGSHMSCSYSHIAIEIFDKKVLKYHPSVIGWKRFRDDAFSVWPHSRENLDLFFNYMNNIDSTEKIEFTMEVAKDILEFLELQLKFDKVSKIISVVIFSKATNSFTYVLPSTCLLKRKIIIRICDSDSKFEKRSAEYQKLPEIKNPAESKNNFLTSEIFRERKAEDLLKLKVIFQLRVI